MKANQAHFRTILKRADVLGAIVLAGFALLLPQQEAHAQVSLWRWAAAAGAAEATAMLWGSPAKALPKANEPAYAYPPAYQGGCDWQNQPAYDGWGNFVGYEPVQVCY